MGSVRFGAPTDLIVQLATRFSIPNFVETGTYLGGTSSWAARNFERVWTSELHPESFRRARENLAQFPNVEIYNESSTEFLHHILADVSGKTLFWLDAHMMPGAVSAGHEHECPVVDEIAAILAWGKATPSNTYLFIDDARLFLAPAALPHRSDEWPSIRELLDALDPVRDSHHIIIADDIVMVVPIESKDFLVDHCQQDAKRRKDAERRGTGMVVAGVRQAVYGMVRTAKEIVGRLSPR